MTLKLHASLHWNDSLIDWLTDRISSSDYILRINWSSESFVDRKCHICLFSFVLFDCEQHIFRFWIKKIIWTCYRQNLNLQITSEGVTGWILLVYVFHTHILIWDSSWKPSFWEIIHKNTKRENYNLVRQFLTWTLGGSKASHAQGELDPPAGKEPTKAQLIRATCAELVAADKAPPGASFICIDLQQ